MEEALHFGLRTGQIRRAGNAGAALVNPYQPVAGFDLVSTNAGLAAYGARQALAKDYDLIVIYGTKQADETRGLIADAVHHLAPEGRLAVIQANDQGAAALEKHLRGIAPALTSASKAKARILCFGKSDIADHATLSQWQAQAAMQPVVSGEYESCPGLFSWNRIDRGSAMLLEALSALKDAGLKDAGLKGEGADFGCGWGYLTRALVRQATVYAVDIDARAIAALSRNAPQAKGIWTDATRPVPGLPALDWIVSNPPFHGLTGEDRRLGQFFIANAAHHLKKGGTLYLVANRHLPYEKILEAHFSVIHPMADRDGYKVIAATR